MKIREHKVYVEKSSSLKDHFFSIDDEDQGIIFDMLRSKIYKDPVGSICREIASNSRDANREMERDDLPITIEIKDINLNNNGTLCVIFSDNGPGISPDRMENVFCKYAASTKRDSNEQTGGYGLGAKTPFSYTDVFSIVTIHEGKKYDYVAYVDESRKGKIVLQNQQETKDMSGTKIIVPIKEGDREEFERKSFEYTYIWTVRPNYVNFDYDIKNIRFNVEYDNRDKRIKIVTSSIYRPRSTYVVIDGIPYKINDYEIYGEERYKNVRMSQEITSSLFIEEDIGVLDISANRETLQYSKITKDILKARIEEIKKHFTENIKKFVEDSTDYVDACIRYSLLTDDHSFFYGNQSFKEFLNVNESHHRFMYMWLKRHSYKVDIKFKDYERPLTTKYIFHTYKYTVLSLLKKGDHYEIRSTSPSNTIHFKQIFQIPVYYMDQNRRNSRRDFTVLIDKKNKNKSMMVISKKLVRKRSYESDDAFEKRKKEFFEKQKDEKELLDKVFEKRLLTYSEIPMMKMDLTKSSSERNKIISKVKVKIVTNSAYRSYRYKNVVPSIYDSRKKNRDNTKELLYHKTLNNFFLDGVILDKDNFMVISVKNMREVNLLDKRVYVESFLYCRLTNREHILYVREKDMKKFEDCTIYYRGILDKIPKKILISIITLYHIIEAKSLILSYKYDELNIKDSEIKNAIIYINREFIKFADIQEKYREELKIISDTYDSTHFREMFKDYMKDIDRKIFEAKNVLERLSSNEYYLLKNLSRFGVSSDERTHLKLHANAYIEAVKRKKEELQVLTFKIT